jgi:hypothetical protein
MDRIFICGMHDKVSIAAELTKLFHEKECVVTDLQVLKVEEGCDLDFKMRTFDDIMDLAEVIFARLQNFKSACVMMSKEVNDKHFSVVMYLIFVNNDDQELFGALSMI